MRRPTTVSGSVVVAAPAREIWAQLADPSQMGRWSPENRGADVVSPGEPLAVGAEFTGRNVRGRARWVTRCRVTASDPGRRFAFVVRAIGPATPRLGARIASWSYDLVPVDGDPGSTTVTETWTDDRRWPDALAAVFDRVVTGGRTFADFQRGNIDRTLDALRDDLSR